MNGDSRGHDSRRREIGIRDRREHRRSRSPPRRRERDDYGRGGNDYRGERNYREREREDRHRERRDDRDYDRRDRRDTDRYARHDRDDRPRRDMRDLFDDRRGGGRRDDDRNGGGRGRGGREPKRSATPEPRRRRAPPPDWDAVVPIDKRVRRIPQWDIKPQGYEAITAEQAKLSGMFPLPGAPRQQTMDPARMQALLQQPADAAEKNALLVAESKQARRAFIRNIPEGVTGDQLKEFFNAEMDGLNCVSQRGSCLSVKLSNDRSVAMLEFNRPEDATLAIAFDGIQMPLHAANENSNGDTDGASNGLKIRRPGDYIIPQYPDGTANDKVVLDGPLKLTMTNLPPEADYTELQSLFAAFEENVKVTLVHEEGANIHKGDTEETAMISHRGIAFLQYPDEDSTKTALETLDGMEIGSTQIRCQRACQGTVQTLGREGTIESIRLLATVQTDIKSRCLRLLNMVTAEDLMDEEEYKDICDEIWDEISKYGVIESMKVPRPTPGNRQSTGIGKIFLKMETAEQAKVVMDSIAGRRFGERTVVVTWYGEDYFDVEAW